MELLLNYMYRGEINVEEKELMGLLATAKGLQIKGLTESDADEDDSDTAANEQNTEQTRPSSNKRPAPVSRPVPSSSQPSSKKIKEEHIPKLESLVVEHEEAVIDEDATGTHHEYNPTQASNTPYLDHMDDPSELIDQSDYSLDGNQSGEAMVYEGDPENTGDYFVQGSGRYQCEICLKTFQNTAKLKRHLLVHTKETPYVCE